MNPLDDLVNPPKVPRWTGKYRIVSAPMDVDPDECGGQPKHKGHITEGMRAIESLFKGVEFDRKELKLSRHTINMAIRSKQIEVLPKVPGSNRVKYRKI
jgi:hypothetical protein